MLETPRSISLTNITEDVVTFWRLRFSEELKHRKAEMFFFQNLNTAY